jgi:hypothetical protein
MDKELGQHEFLDATAKWGRDFVEVLNPLKENEILRVYHEPSQRKWVGLTAKDLAEIPSECIEGAIWADAKLKEKNGF